MTQFTRCPVCKCKNTAYLEKSRDWLGGRHTAIVLACGKNYRHNYKLKRNLKPYAK